MSTARRGDRAAAPGPAVLRHRYFHAERAVARATCQAPAARPGARRPILYPTGELALDDMPLTRHPRRAARLR